MVKTEKLEETKKRTTTGKEELTKGFKSEITNAIGERFHEERRKTRIKEDGKYEPRIEKAIDNERIKEHNGQTEVDIANTFFEDLPVNRKKENLEAAEIVLELVYEKIKKGDEITTEMIEEMAKTIHEKRLERNGAEGSFKNQRVEYKELSEEEKQKDRNQIIRAIEIIKKILSKEYFGGKSHKFEIKEEQARENSKMMDGITRIINEKNKKEILKRLGNEINKQYKEITKTENELKLTYTQLETIIQAHKKSGKLGELTIIELKEKVEKLCETIDNPEIRRFLLESGFCGSINRGINTEEREISQVQRKSDIIAIGDLHGEYNALKENLGFIGAAEETNGHLKRTGGDKKVIFQGDILADRGTDGLKIIKEIHNLREQAQKEGGDIEIIVGNHDDFFISYLLGATGKRYKGHNAIEISMLNKQGKGLTELLKFIGMERVGQESDFINLRNNKAVLNAMRQSAEGRLILEEICNMKIIKQVDDVLYIHTNPTQEMLRYLTNGDIQSNIDGINYFYQGYLRHKLLGEGTGEEISEQDFNEISDIFLNTSNRNDKMGGIDIYCKKLKESGINMISHGHNGGAGYNQHAIEIGGIKIVDTDYTFMKGGNSYGEGHSVSVVKKGGGAHYMGDNAFYAR